MFWQVTLDLLEGFGVSLEIFAITLLGAIPLGLIICFGSMSTLGFTLHLPKRLFAKGENKAPKEKQNPFPDLVPIKKADGMRETVSVRICPIAILVKLFVWVIRGTPLMLQLIFIYYDLLWPGSAWHWAFAALFGVVYCVCHQLRLLFLGNLPRRYRIHSARTV